MRQVDYRLNAIVDASLSDVGHLPELAAIAAKSGATILQYRDKSASTRLMIERASAIRQAIAEQGFHSSSTIGWMSRSPLVSMVSIWAQRTWMPKWPVACWGRMRS